MGLPKKLPLDLMQDRWASILNPLLSNQLTQGLLLKDQFLTNGVTILNHRLGRKMVGWFITDISGAAQIYRAAPLDDLTLTLTSDAAVVASLWVF